MEVLTKEFVLERGSKSLKFFNQDKITARLTLMSHSEKNIVAMVKASFDEQYEKYLYHDNSFWTRLNQNNRISCAKISFRKFYTDQQAFEYWLKTIEEASHSFSWGRDIDFIFLKPFFYERIGEPRYVVMTFGFKDGTCVFVETDYNTNIMAERYFNALDRDKAIILGKEIAKRRGGDDFSIYGNIKIIKPEYFKVDSIKQHTNVNEFSKKLQQVADSDMSPVAKTLWAFVETGKIISDIAKK